MAGTKNDGKLYQKNASSAVGKSGGYGRAARSHAAGVVMSNDGSPAVSSASSVSGMAESATAKSEQIKSGKNVYEYLDSFASSVENSAPVNAVDSVTNSINSVDCGDMVYKFMEDNIPFFKQGMSMLNAGIGFLNSLNFGVSLSKALSSSDMVQKICDMLANIWGTLDGFIEIFVKGAFVVFKRIDAMLERLETTLVNLTEAVRNCILDVMRDLSGFMKKSINMGLNIDWDTLTGFMQDCPCVSRVVATLTGCKEDSEGNDIRDNPAAIIECIRNKFPFLNPVNLTTSLDKVFNDYVKKYIDKAFDFLESWIEFIYKLMVKPLRALIKKYAEMLRHKIDVTGLIKTVGPFECFLVYSEEYKGGKKYYGMSVIDMINTFRQWIPCFQHACPGFSEKVKNRTQEIYKDLRLDDKYWRSVYAIDIYMMCINAELDGATPRDTDLRAMYGQNPIDLIMSWFRSSKNRKNAYDSELGVDNAVASMDEVNEYMSLHGEPPPNSPSPLASIVALDGKTDNENDVNSGDGNIDINAENAVIAMMENMHAAGETFYVEKFYQLIRLMNNYATSPKFLDKAHELLSTIETVDTTYRDTGDNMPILTGRPDVIDESDEKIATYTLEDDFDEARVAALSSGVTFSGYAAICGSREDFYAGRYSGVVTA